MSLGFILNHKTHKRWKRTERSSTDDHVVNQRNDHVKFTHSTVKFDSEQPGLQRVNEDYRDVLL